MGFDYKKYDGIALGELIKKKEVKISEVVEAAIKTIEEKNKTLNAVIHKFYENNFQMKETVQSDSLFAGVPMLLKDIAQEMEGEVITSGSALFQTYKASTDSEYVRRLREMDVVFLGYTNVPELALMGVTEPKMYGATKNPWNESHTPGGSSGGSAAAVASGMVPIAGANDGGGSIRIPAAYCGLFGLKPSRGRMPVGPHVGRVWQGASTEHVLTRSVRDSAAMLDELTKTVDRSSAFYVTPYEGSYLDCVSTPLNGTDMKVAFSVQSPLGLDVHSDCKEAVLKTVELLDEMGFHVEEKDAPIDGKKIANSYLTLYFGEVAASIQNAEKLLERKVKMGDVEATTWLLHLLGKATSAGEFVQSLQEWDVAAIAMEEFHDQYIFYITPTTAYPPAQIGELESSSLEKLLMKIAGSLNLGKLLKKTNIVDQIAEKSLKRTPFTQLANLTGQPAMSMPVHKTEDGLPCGVQVMTRKGREDLLYRLAGMLEETHIWIDVTKEDFYR